MITEAKRHLTDAFIAGILEGDGWLPEACESVNDASRVLVGAMLAEHGQAWVGRITRYPKDRERGPNTLRQVQAGEVILNFAACFVLPCYDAELEARLQEREAAEYTGTAADGRRIDAIFERVEAVGGFLLHWS